MITDIVLSFCFIMFLVSVFGLTDECHPVSCLFLFTEVLEYLICYSLVTVTLVSTLLRAERLVDWLISQTFTRSGFLSRDDLVIFSALRHWEVNTFRLWTICNSLFGRPKLGFPSEARKKLVQAICISVIDHGDLLYVTSTIISARKTSNNTKKE